MQKADNNGSLLKQGKAKNVGISAGYKPNIKVAGDPESLARQCLEFFVAKAEKAIEEEGAFRVAISGGNTPKRFFELLGEAPQAKNLPWDKIQLFWVDERYVPPDSPSSNYRLAAGTFLTKVAIPKKNVHRIPTEYDDIKMAARCYEEEIRKVFGLEEGRLPRFDLVVLGMGAEGHTGSLFPNSFAPFDKEDLACVVYELDEKLSRITLTHPVLLAASCLVVLVSGEEKAGILKEVMTAEPDEVRYPIHLLWPVLNKIVWLVDNKAAKFLQQG